jgi:hypothetical protein
MEVDTSATERIETWTEHLGTRATGVGSPPTIRMEDIERPYRKEKYLR